MAFKGLFLLKGFCDSMITTAQISRCLHCHWKEVWASLTSLTHSRGVRNECLFHLAVMGSQQVSWKLPLVGCAQIFLSFELFFYLALVAGQCVLLLPLLRHLQIWDQSISKLGFFSLRVTGKVSNINYSNLYIKNVLFLMKLDNKPPDRQVILFFLAILRPCADPKMCYVSWSTSALQAAVGWAGLLLLPAAPLLSAIPTAAFGQHSRAGSSLSNGAHR